MRPALLDALLLAVSVSSATSNVSPGSPRQLATSSAAAKYVAHGWEQASKLGGRLVYPPFPTIAPQVFGPDMSCSGGICGIGAESVKLAMVVPSAAKTPPAMLLPPDCSSGVPGCVRLPQPVAAPAGLVLDRSAPLFTATTGGPANGSPTYAAAFGDVNGDGAPDLFLGVARDTNELWINDGTGSFTAATGGPASGSGDTKAAAFGDVNGDGVR